ncbi:MAG: hypothetical protein FWD76_03180 [Firmicutes bacterium]|nr:hypothetical protein [Bacillota bacterium]
MISTTLGISWEQFGDWLSSPQVLTGLGIAITILGVIYKLFRSKISSWLVAPLIKLLTKYAPTVIAAVDQEFVDALRKVGEWSEKYYHEAMELAYKKMQAMLTHAQWSLLEKLVGKDEIRELIKSIINQVLRDSKPTLTKDNKQEQTKIDTDQKTEGVL